MTEQVQHISADKEMRERLLPLRPVAEHSSEPDQSDLDTLLARVVWARLVEPGDAVAGWLIGSLGAGTALDRVVSGIPATSVCDEARKRCDGAEPPVRIDQIDAGMRRWRPRIDRGDTLTDLDRAGAGKMALLSPDSPAWPAILDDLGLHAPVLLWTVGDVSLLSSYGVAVVGARACTGYGTQVTAELCDTACSAGAVIVSGAAYGIDAVAHRTAFAAGAPTIGVVAGGADRPYPAAHAEMYRRIGREGLLCTEMVPGSAPTRWRFLQRNRIIACLGRATLVTEAGVRSGSLNTAGHASQLARPLGAVPGPVTSPASAGCHRLIREYGATVITNGAELRELLGLDDDPVLFGEADPADARDGEPAGGRQPALHRRILDALPLRGSRSLDDVARAAGVDEDEARSALAELRVLGYVDRHETPDGSAAWKLQRRE